MTEPRHVPPLRLEVQFEDLTKQRHAAHFGMWLFIVSDAMTFSAMLIGYSYARVSSDQWPTPFEFYPSIVFSTVMKVRFDDDPRTASFALYLFCGLIPWLAFSDGLSRATTAIHDQASLVKRIRFPSEILPLHQVLVIADLVAVRQQPVL